MHFYTFGGHFELLKVTDQPVLKQYQETPEKLFTSPLILNLI